MSVAVAIDKQTQRNNERLAWGVIWVAFAIFCIMFAVGAVGVYYFLFNSTVPVQTQLRVSRGTLGVTGTDLLELVVRNPRYLLPGDAVNIPADSQAVLYLDDTRLGDTFVAAITMRNDSSITFSEASRPRFEWSTEGYRVQLGNVRGDFDVLISPDLGRGVFIELQTATGDRLFLTDAGRYLITARGDALEVANLDGTALLVSEDRASTRAIPAGQRGILRLASNQIDSRPGYINLVGETSFRENAILVTDSNVLAEQTTALTNWVCADPPHDPPRGVSTFSQIDGRATVHILRGDDATTHGETRCTQRFGPGALGVDISGYTYLAVRATFRVDAQSLAVCGVVASECPLMVNMQYVPSGVNAEAVTERDPNDFGAIISPLTESPARNWYKGFYIVPAGERPSPLRCDSCAQEHSFIRAGEWYTYDSGNLLASIPESQRPRYLLNVSFYASGHQYDVYVSDLMLLVGNIDSGN
jgi:hypothetical protein